MSVVDGDAGRVDGDERDVASVRDAGVVRQQSVEIRRPRVVDVLSVSLIKNNNFKDASGLSSLAS